MDNEKCNVFRKTACSDNGVCKPSDIAILKQLKCIIENHFNIEPPENLIMSISSVIFDNAFCLDKSQWYELRVIKEIKLLICNLGYESLLDWVQITQSLPSPYLTKEEASAYLSDLKAIEIRAMLLAAARNIHPLFHSIIKKEINNFIPYEDLERISLNDLDKLETGLTRIMKMQAQTILQRQGFQTWKAWQDHIDGKSKPALALIS